MRAALRHELCAGALDTVRRQEHPSRALSPSVWRLGVSTPVRRSLRRMEPAIRGGRAVSAVPAVSDAAALSAKARNRGRIGDRLPPSLGARFRAAFAAGNARLHPIVEA